MTEYAPQTKKKVEAFNLIIPAVEETLEGHRGDGSGKKILPASKIKAAKVEPGQKLIFPTKHGKIAWSVPISRNEVVSDVVRSPPVDMAKVRQQQDLQQVARIRKFIHGPGTERKIAKSLVKMEDRLIGYAIEYDPALSTAQKAHWLRLSSELSKSHQAGLREALHRQLALISPVAIARPAPTAAKQTSSPPAAVSEKSAAPKTAPSIVLQVPLNVLAQEKITATSMLKHPWVNGYKNKLGTKLNHKTSDIITAHWADIQNDVDKWWASRGSEFEYEGLMIQGPNKHVTLKDLTALVILTYLAADRSGLDAHFLQAIIGKESNFRHQVDSSNGSGMAQFIDVGLAGAMERTDEVNGKLAEWGHSPLDPHFGQVKHGRRWASMVEFQKTVTVKHGKRTRTKTVRVEPDFDKPLKPQGTLVRASGFKAYFADPVNSVEALIALLIVKKAKPNMTREEMREAARNYNGNTTSFTSPEGYTMSVRDRYGAEMPARVDYVKYGKK